VGKIWSARPDSTRYFGGEEYIPAYNGGTTIVDDHQQTFDTSE
jgi:hypothetical protein